MANDSLTIIIKEQGSSSSSSETSTGTGKTEKTQEKGFTNVAGAVKGLLPALAGIGIGLALLHEALKPVTQILKYIFFLTLLPILNILAKAFPSGTAEKAKTGLGIAKEGLNELGSDNGLFNTTKDYFKGLGDTVSEANTGLSGFSKAIWAFLGGVLAPFVIIWDILKSVVYATIEAFNLIWNAGVELGKLIKEVLIDAWNGLIAVIKSSWDFLKGLGEFVWGLIEDGFSGIANFATKIWDLFVIGLSGIATFATDIWGLFTIGLADIANFGADIWALFKTGLSTIGDIGTKIWKWFKGVLNDVTERLGFGRQLAFGGTVSRDGIYSLHAGETVNTASQSGGGNNTFNINITGSYNNTDELVRKLTTEVSRRVGR